MGCSTANSRSSSPFHHVLTGTASGICASAGGPYRLLPKSPLWHVKTRIVIGPASGTRPKNHHQPLRPQSCILRTKVPSRKNHNPTQPSSTKGESKIRAKVMSGIQQRRAKSANHQYSAREDRPRQSEARVKPRRTASGKLTIAHLVVDIDVECGEHHSQPDGASAPHGVYTPLIPANPAGGRPQPGQPRTGGRGGRAGPRTHPAWVRPHPPAPSQHTTAAPWGSSCDTPTARRRPASVRRSSLHMPVRQAARPRWR